MNYPRFRSIAIVAFLVVFLFAWFGLTANSQVLYPTRGGTGASTTPALGQVLVGQTDGTYRPQATSTLGIAAEGGVTAVTGSYPVISSGGTTPALSLGFGTSTENSWGALQQFNAGASATQLTIGSLTGFLKATSGAVSAVTSIVPADFSLPKGNFPVGDDAGVAQATSTIFLDSVGKFGIGTTSPQSRLHVANGFSGGIATDTTGLTIENSANTSLNFQVPLASSGGIVWGSPGDPSAAQITYGLGADLMTIGTGNTGGDIAFVVGNGGEAVRILDSGYVGIGTTDADSPLEIYGNGYGLELNFPQTNQYNGILFKQAETTYGAITIRGSAVSDVNKRSSLEFSTKTTNGGAIDYYPRGVFAMRIATDGNIGIGTTSPADLLNVSRSATNSTGGLTLTNQSTAGWGSALTFTGTNGGATTNAARIYGEHTGAGSNGTLTFQTLAAGTLGTRMTISQLGAVGIVGIAGIGTEGVLSVTAASESAYAVRIKNTTYSASIPIFSYYPRNDGSFEQGTDQSKDFRIYTNGAGNTRLTVASGGNVGVGTTSPTGILDLFTTGTTTLRVDTNSATQGSCLVLKDSDGSGYTYVTANGGALSASVTPCN